MRALSMLSGFRSSDYRIPWALPLMAGAWYLSFEALRYCDPFLRYLGHVNPDGSVSNEPVPTHIQIKCAVLAAVIDYALWVGYVGLRRAPHRVELRILGSAIRVPGSVRAWVLLGAGSVATIYFQAHWDNPASWVPPVFLLLSLWVTEASQRSAPERSVSDRRIVAVPAKIDDGDKVMEVEVSAVDVVRTLVRQDPKVSALTVAQKLDVSDSYARRLLRRARTELPETNGSANGSPGSELVPR